MQQVADGIRALRRENKTIFVVTHDPEFIAACCNTVLLVDHGRIQESCSLDAEGMVKLKAFFC